MTFRFVHAADLHLDTPFEGIGKLSPDIQRALQDASLDAFDNLINLCISERVAFLLLAGDIYDGADRGVRAQLQFSRGLQRLADLGIKTFIIHGNHDPLDGWSAVRKWPEGVTIFDSRTVGSVSVEVDGRSIATIHGISYPTRMVTDNLALQYQRGSTSSGVQIGLLHCTVGSSTDHASYSPCTLNDLLDRGMDYWALGHIHKRQVLHTGHPWVVYPGNLQGRSPKPSERDAKGAYLVEVDGQNTISTPRFVPLDVIRFLSIETEISEIADMPQLQRTLSDEADRLRSEHENRSLLLRGRLSGRGTLYSDLGHRDGLESLLRDLREEGKHSVPFLYWSSLSNETRPGIDRASILSGQRFSSEMLKFIDQVPEDADVRKRLENCFDIPRFVKTNKFGVELSGIDQLMAEAEDLALDLLESGEQQ